jgi:hypothetical protein
MALKPKPKVRADGNVKPMNNLRISKGHCESELFSMGGLETVAW